VCLGVRTVAGFLVVAVVPVFGLPDLAGFPVVLADVTALTCVLLCV